MGATERSGEIRKDKKTPTPNGADGNKRTNTVFSLQGMEAGMDIFERIKKDHDDARGIISKIKDTTEQAHRIRTELFTKFKNDMWAHHKVEEAVFYSYLRDDTEMSNEAYEALNEHHIANGLLEELDTFPADSEQWEEKFGALSEVIEHHMDEEENEFFPKARKIIASETADVMGRRFDSRKKVVLAAIMPISEDDLKAA